jgi:membrane protease YdiL (CAAX protease family)
MPLLLGFINSMYVWFGGPAPKTKTASSFVVTFLLSFPVGSLGEEFGWRGIMTPRVMFILDDWYGAHDQNMGRDVPACATRRRWKWAPLVSCIIVGACWACWHLPAFFVHSLSQIHCNFAQFFLQEILYSVFYTFLSIHTNYSILGAIIMHASINTFGALVPWGDVEYPNFVALPNSFMTIMMFVFVVVLIWTVGIELNRGNATITKFG